MTFDHTTIYINFITVSIFYTQIMKKFFYLLLLLPLAMISTSCDDDDDKVPDVNISASITNGVVKDGVIYAVKGDTLIVDQITHRCRDILLGPLPDGDCRRCTLHGEDQS